MNNIELGEVLDFYNGKAIKPGGDGEYNVYGSNGLIGRSNEYKHANAIVIGRVGAYCGAIQYEKNKFWASDNTIVAIPKEHGLQSYFAYLLRFMNLRRYAGGAAQPLLTQITLKKLKTKIPASNSCMIKIGAILQAYDDLIENNNRRIKILEEMTQTIYDEWFVGFRFPGHSKIKMVDSELGKIPEGWIIVTLGDICLRITDGSHWSPKGEKDGFPMASVKDMRNWDINVCSCRKISKPDYDDLVKNDCKPKKNDVLIAKDGSYLKHIFVVEEEKELVILSSIAILRPSERACPHYLAIYLKKTDTKMRMKGYVSGAALPRIILKDFKNFKIMLPSVGLQNRFVELVNPMIRLIHNLLDKNERLNISRDILFPKLISGEIDVENMDIDIGDVDDRELLGTTVSRKSSD